MTSPHLATQDRSTRTLFVAALVLSCVALRVLTLPAINASTDEVWVWANAKKLVLGYPFHQWDHHTGRLFTVAAAALAQLVLGTDPWVYHVAPIVAYATGGLFLFVIALRLASYEGALLAWLGWILLPELARRSADHVSDLFAAVNIIIALYFLVRVLSRDPHTRRDVVLLALFCFLAYSSKETAVLFFPGMFLALWFHAPHKRWALVWAGLLFALFIAETLFLNAAAGVTLGRYALMKKFHLQNDSVSEVNIRGLFARFVRAAPSWKLMFGLAAGSALLWLRGRKTSSVVGVWAFLVPSLSFLLLLAFCVRSIHPLVPALPFRNRYLLPCIGPLLLSAVVLSRPFFEELGAKLSALESARTTPIRRVATLVLLLAAGLYGFRARYRHEVNPKAIPQLLASTRELRKAYESNTPFVALGRSTGAEKQLYVFNAVFRPDLFTDAHQPDSSEYKSFGAYDPVRVTLNGRWYFVVQKRLALSETEQASHGPMLFADGRSTRLQKRDISELKPARKRASKKQRSR